MDLFLNFAFSFLLLNTAATIAVLEWFLLAVLQDFSDLTFLYRLNCELFKHF